MPSRKKRRFLTEPMTVGERIEIAELNRNCIPSLRINDVETFRANRHVFASHIRRARAIDRAIDREVVKYQRRSLAEGVY